MTADTRHNCPRRGWPCAVLASVLFAVVLVSMVLQASVMYAVAADGVVVANAGPDQQVTVGKDVTIDGSGSTGPITKYNWTIDYHGLPITYENRTFTISFANTGIYNLTLNVTDGQGNYSTDTMTVTVTERPFSILDYWELIAIVGAIIAVAVFLWAAATGRIRTIPEATQEKLKMFFVRWRKILAQVLRNPMGLTGVIILVFFMIMAAFGPTIAPYKIDPTVLGDFGQYEKPSAKHWLGTDVYRYDIFSELLYGARTSMIVGCFSAVIASVLGALVGLYSGYAGGWKDETIMRANDVVLSIPWLVLMIVVAALLRKIDLTGIILIIGLTGWSTTARMVRAQVLSLKERQFVERARAVGASDMSIIRRHILPNAFPLVFANTILTVAISILSEATLSFLGMRPVNTITWGTMLSRAAEADAFHIGLQGWIILPGVCIVAVVLGFTLLGYALDDIMNPKLRKR